MQLAKDDFGSVFGLVLQKTVGFRFGCTKLTTVSFFSVLFLHCVLFNVYAVYSVLSSLHSSVDAIFHLRLYGMMLEMTYFRAELVQLIVSRSDSELEMQRRGMKKNT